MKAFAAAVVLLCCFLQETRAGCGDEFQEMQRKLAVLEELQSRLDSSENLIQVLQSRLDSSENLTQVLQSRLDSSENISQVLQSNMETLKKQIEDCELVKDGLTNLTDSYSHLQTSLDQLKISHNTLQSNLSRLLCESVGFTWDGEVCYYVSKPGENNTWDESRRFCTAKQADLMIINSQEKQDLLGRVAQHTLVWIGLTDRETEGSFKWVDGKPLSSPMFWNPLQPNNGGGDEDCVLDSGRWHDYPCSLSTGWMCEKVVQ